MNDTQEEREEHKEFCSHRECEARQNLVKSWVQQIFRKVDSRYTHFYQKLTQVLVKVHSKLP